jgi:hypothetical protein
MANLKNERRGDRAEMRKQRAHLLEQQLIGRDFNMLGKLRVNTTSERGGTTSAYL